AHPGRGGGGPEAPHGHPSLARLRLRRPLSRGRKDRRVRLVLRERGGVRDQALELVEGDVGDRLEHLLVVPADLARLLDEVRGRASVGLQDRLEEGEERRLARIARLEAAGARYLVEAEAA